MILTVLQVDNQKSFYCFPEGGDIEQVFGFFYWNRFAANVASILIFKEKKVSGGRVQGGVCLTPGALTVPMA